MPRDKRKVERRELAPDVKYKSILLAKFINKTMERGKKSLAQNLVYKAMDQIKEEAKKDPLEVFEQAIKNASPILEVRSRRIGGATYQVPMEVRGGRKIHLAISWILKAAREQQGKDFPKLLAEEILNAYNNQGSAIKKKEDVLKMAEANRAFAHLARY